MDFQFSDEQLATIKNEYNAARDENIPWSFVYETVLNFISVPSPDPATPNLKVPAAGVNGAVWQFITAGAFVNDGQGGSAQADVVGAYTANQMAVRLGVSATSDETTAQIQLASDRIAEAVIARIVFSGALPTIDQIAEDDASNAAAFLFEGDEGGWAGNPLFVPLAHSASWQENVLAEERGTYDILAAISSARYAGLSVSNPVDALIDFWSATSGSDVGLVDLADAWLVETSEALFNAYGGVSPLFDILNAAVFNNIVLGTIYSDNDILGSAGTDVINGGAGDDRLIATQGQDLLDGGSGDDTIDYSLLFTANIGFGINVTIEDNSDANAEYTGFVSSLFMSPDPTARDELYGIERIVGSARNDDFQLNDAVGHLRSLDGQGGNEDELSASGLSEGVIVDAISGQFSVGNTTYDIANFEVYEGSDFNDTFIVNVSATNRLSGRGGDYDVADFSHNASPLEIAFDSGSVVVSDGSDQATTLDSIERIIGTAEVDILKIIGEIPTGTLIDIDGGSGHDPSLRDVVDVTAASREMNVSIAENGLGYIRAEGGDSGIILLTDFSSDIIGSGYDDNLVDLRISGKLIDAGDGDDQIRVAGYGEIDGGVGNDTIVAVAPQYINNGDGTYERLEIDGGADDDTLTSLGGQGAVLYGGSGNDTLSAWTFGAELYGGEGEDHFIWSPNTLVGDGEGHDRLSLFGIISLTGGLAYGGEESEWAAQSLFPFIKYGINTDGELVVNFLGEEMYVANYTGGPGAETNTLGIYVAALEFDFYRLIFDRPSIEATPLSEILTAMFKTMGIVDADDPLMLDLDGDGLEFTTLGQSETYFDLDGDGFAENTGWLRSDDGMLVLDRNGNGNIDDISELFGAPGVAGFTELADLDSNEDGVIDANDARFAELQVWRDLNQDGVSDAGELFSLAELDIVSFDLNATAMDVQTSTDHSLRAQASFTRGDGTQGDMFEVILNSSQFETRYLGDHGIADWAKDLPDVKGYGLMTDLKLAAANDFELAELTENVTANLTATNLDDLVSAVQPILLAWNDTNPGSRELAPVLIQTDANGTQRLDHAVYEEDGSGGYWRLDSGAPVLDGSGVAIARPTLEDILDQTAGAGQSWQLQQIWSPERDAETTDRLEAPYRVTVDSEGVVSILDHGVYVEDAQGGYWQLASGAAILDASGVAIARPTLEDVLAQSAAEGESWWLEVFAEPAQSAQVNDMAVFYDAAGTSIYDYAVFVADGAGGGYWASAREVSAAAGAGLTAPAGPTHTDLQSFIDLYSAQLGATSAHAEVIDADRARYAAKTGGVNLGDLTTLISGTDESGVIIYNHNLDQQREFLTELIARFDYWEEAVAVRLAMQGGLSNFFQEIEYDAEADIFRATGERELIPTFEAIFAAAPGDATGALNYLEDWKPILDVVYVDFGRHGAGEMSASFLFANVVAAYESQGLAVGLMAAADILGVPTEQIIADSTDGAVVNGDAEDNIFYLSTGDQVFKGGQGRDVYVVGKNFGSDVIEDIEEPFTDRGADSVRFADIKSTDVSARREGIDLIIRVDATGDELRIVEQFEGRKPAPPVADASNDTGVVEIIFADGVVWNMVEMAMAVSNPLPSDDVLIGTGAIDVLDGGAGDDVLSGGSDSDIYIYNSGYGNDQIEDNNEWILLEHYDMVKFGEGIEKDSLVFNRDGPSYDLTITFDTAGDSLTLINQFDATYTGSFGKEWLDRIELLTFSDGSSYLWSDIMEKMVADGKTDGDDTIYGFDYEDRLDGGAGNDFLSGGNETDTYIFAEGYGQDIIEDDQDNILSGNEDRLIFEGGLLQSDIIFTRNAGSDDLVIELAGTTDTVTLRNQFSYAHTGVFGVIYFDQIEYFEFSDGYFLNARQVEEVILEQGKTDGNDSIYGFAQQDVLDGGAGDDYLAGAADSDTYIFATGYGHDTIFDNEENILFGAVDKVAFGAGITTSDLTLSRDGDTLHIDINGTIDRLTIEKQFSANNLGMRLFQIEEFHFDDGTIWNARDVQYELLNAGSTDGDDILIGFFSTDILDGGAGNDSLVGGNGSDTYIFGRGYDQDVVEELATSIFADLGDQILFREDIAVGDLILSHQGNDLTFEIAGTADRLTVINQFSADNLGNRMQEIETFAFADGTIWNVAQVQEMLLQGTDGDDFLAGFFSADTLDGGLGNDRLEGGNEADTYIFDSGYGHDVVEDYMTSIFYPDPDIVSFGAGITSDSVHLARSGDLWRDLTITFEGLSDSLTIENIFFTPYYEIEEFHFASGEIWSLDDVRAKLVTGTDGDDTLRGFDTADTLYGGLGNDRLEGSSNSDTYIFNVGDGQDVIYDFQSAPFASGPDIISFGAGISASDLTLTRTGTGGWSDGRDMLITFDGLTDSILVEDMLFTTLREIEEFHFADGTIWTLADIWGSLLGATDGNDDIIGTGNADVLSGLAGDDTLTGKGGNDSLIGGEGNDTLYGGDGSDTYIFTRGDGVDLINESGFADTDRLVLHDYTPAEVVLGRAAPGSGDLVLTFAGTGDQITIRYALDNNVGGNIEEYVFDDGTVWTPDDLRAMILSDTQTDGDDVVHGFKTNDVLEGGLGNDELHGGSGSDDYIFTRGDGVDLIEDNGYLSTDRLVLQGYIPEEVIVGRTSANSGHVVLTFVGTSDQITINNTLNGGSADVIEQVVFDNGTIWTPDDLRVMVLDATQTDGDDLIYGFKASDQLEGGLGNDQLYGGEGSDDYIFTRGDGVDVMEDNGYLSTDRLVIHGYTPDEVTIGRVSPTSKHVVLTFDGTSDQITIRNTLDGSASDTIEQIVFDDATIWTPADLRAALLTGGDGDDALYGFKTADTLDGGLGNDRMEGGFGGDTYHFDSGEGNDVIRDAGYNNDFDKVIFGAGILASDILLSYDPANAENLIIEVISTGDTLTIEKMFSNSGYHVESFEFADGSSWTRGYVQAIVDGLDPNAPTHEGTAGNDVINGSSSDDIFAGYGGDDTLNSNGGNDTFLYASGDGSDKIDENSSSNLLNDTLKFTDLNVADLTFSRVGVDLMIAVNATGHVIEVDEQFYSTSYNYGIEVIEFADGSSWDRAEIQSNAWIRGTAGVDSLTGSSGDDVFVGGTGDDVIYSTGGSDTFIYASGDGSDKIDEENGSTSYTDVLKFTDLNAADISLSKVGNDLMVTVIGTGDVIEVDEHFYSASYNYGIEVIEFADSTSLDRAEINAQATAAPAAAAQAGTPDFSSALRTLNGAVTANDETQADSVSLADLLDDPGVEDAASIEAQILTLVDPLGDDASAAPSGSSGDAGLASLAIFDAALVMPELAVEDYGATQ